jgi:hypothetical protein
LKAQLGRNLVEELDEVDRRLREKERAMENLNKELYQKDQLIRQLQENTKKKKKK